MALYGRSLAFFTRFGKLKQTTFNRWFMCQRHLYTVE